MRFILITSSFFILICSMVISFSHTLDFFHDAGYRGIFAILAVAAVEVAFLSFALALLTFRVRGVKPGWSTVLGCLVCTVFITWTNIRNGIGLGIEGIMAGIIIPFLLVIVEATLSKELSSKSKHPIASSSKMEPSSSSHPEKLESSHDSNPEKSSSNPGKAGASNLNESNSRSPGIFNSNSNVESSPENIPVSNSESNSSSNSNLNAGKSSSNKSSSTTGTTGQTGKETKLEVLEGGKKLEPELEHIKQVALEIYRKEGKVPGRPRIQKETGCNEGQAKRVRAWLKEELGA